MAAIFAVFIITLLAVFLRPEGRAERFARARALARSSAHAGRSWFSRGSEAVERLSAELASEESEDSGLDSLLGQSDPAPAPRVAD
jgi:hypothetical protein